MGTPQCLLWMAALFGTMAVTISGSDIGEAVYHGCSEARYAQGSAYESNLSKLMVSILSQTPSNGYRNASVGGGNGVVRGLFQCRGDLGDADCFECKRGAVARAPQLCGGAVGARVQLRGCYLRYDNGALFSGGIDPETLVYKACSRRSRRTPGFLPAVMMCSRVWRRRASGATGFGPRAPAETPVRRASPGLRSARAICLGPSVATAWLRRFRSSRTPAVRLFVVKFIWKNVMLLTLWTPPHPLNPLKNINPLKNSKLLVQSPIM